MNKGKSVSGRRWSYKYRKHLGHKKSSIWSSRIWTLSWMLNSHWRIISWKATILDCCFIRIIVSTIWRMDTKLERDTVRHCFIYIIFSYLHHILIHTTILEGSYCYPHFIDKETEVVTSFIIYQSHTSIKRWIQVFNPIVCNSNAHGFPMEVRYCSLSVSSHKRFWFL